MPNTRTHAELVQACYDDAYRFALGVYCGPDAPCEGTMRLAREYGLHEVERYHGLSALEMVRV